MQMESHVFLAGSQFMQLRKVLNFNSVLGVTFPKEYTNSLGLEPKGYVEISLTKEATIIIRKHQPYQPTKGLNGTEPARAYA